MQLDVQAKERLQAPAEAAARAPHALGDRPDPAAVARVEVQDPVGLAVAQRAQHDRLGLDLAVPWQLESRFAGGATLRAAILESMARC